MKVLFSLIALSMIVALSFAQYETQVFANPTSFTPALTTVAPTSNGYLLTLNGPGFVFGDPIFVAYGFPVTTWATLLRSTGNSAIGLVAAGECPTPITSSVNNNAGLLNGLANTGNTCPADFATVYTTRPATGTTSTTTSSDISLVNSPLVVGAPVGWTITQAANAANQNTPVGNAIGIQVANQGVANSGTITVSTNTALDTAANANGNTAQEFALATRQYSLYLQTTSTASACIQNEAQFNTNPGECGDRLFVVGHTAQSAGILSTSICVFVALISFIFFN